MIAMVYDFLELLGFHQPLHPVPVRFTAAMIVGALVFALIARRTRRPMLYTTARHVFTFGVIAFVFTVLTGLMDWFHFYGATWNHPIRMKMILSIVLLPLLVLAAHLNMRKIRLAKRSDATALLIVYALAAVVVSFIVYYGGELAR